MISAEEIKNAQEALKTGVLDKNTADKLGVVPDEAGSPPKSPR